MEQPSPRRLLSQWRHLPVFCRKFWILVIKRKKQGFRAGHTRPQVQNAVMRVNELSVGKSLTTKENPSREVHNISKTTCFPGNSL